jgi:hypothetical protein
MKKDNLIWWVLGGIAAFGIYRYYTKNNKATISEQDLTKAVLKDEQNKYIERGSLLANYNIILPADMVSKKVKAKGEELRQGRFAIQPQRINEPVFI